MAGRTRLLFTTKHGIGANFGDSKFGQATSTWDPRVLQLGGKFNF